MAGAPEAELLPAWAADPWHKLLTWEGVGPQSWGAGAVPWDGGSLSASWPHFEFPTPLEISNTIGCCYGAAMVPLCPRTTAEVKGLDLPLLLIPVPDRAFPKSRVRFGQTNSPAQACAWLGGQGTVVPAEESAGCGVPTVSV